MKFILFLRGALKTRRWSVLGLWIVTTWSLKNKEVFRIRLMDCPGMEPKNKKVSRIGHGLGSSPSGALKTRRCSRLDLWIVPAFFSGSALCGTLKTLSCRAETFFDLLYTIKTSLLRRLQAQTLPDAIQTIGKIPPLQPAKLLYFFNQ